MNKKNIGYVLLVVIAFVIGTQTNIQLESSQVVTSDDIAIINNDQRMEYLDSDIKFGDEFLTQIDNIESDYNYQTTNSAEADQGMISGKYAATITIPSNFTKGILSVNSERPTATSITYALNEDLPATKAKKIETEIVSNINVFENNITYMYLYSVFDGLHTTQEGVKTVAKNGKPVFSFLKDLGEIDIVSNHQYKLKDNNDDSFDAIDISKQVAAFGKTVSEYKQEVAGVIEVYKEQDDKYNNAVDEAIAVMNDNNTLLNDRIRNVEDTLQTIVDTNEQYTEDEYSITGARGNLTEIIIEYIEQLKIVNDTVDNNDKLIDDTSTIDGALAALNANSQYTSLLSLIQSRVSYYNSLDSIVNECLSQDQTGASSCISTKLSGYKNKYNSYDSFISQFRDEENYYDTMTYYLEKIGTNAAAAEQTSDEMTEFEVPIESSEVEAETDSELPDEAALVDQVTLSAASYGQNMTPTTTSDNNLVGLQINNLENIEELVIDTSGSSNVSSITLLNSKQNNCEIVVNGDKIEITEMAVSQLDLVFDVTETVSGIGTVVDFATGTANTSVTIGQKNALTVTPTVTPDNITLDYQYTYQADDEIINYQDSKLATTYGPEVFTLVDDADGVVSLDPSQNGFKIDGTGAKAGDIINFTIEFANQLPSGIWIENYTINDEPNSFLIINDQMKVSTSMNVNDDPIFGADLNNNDDIDENDNVEPNEQLGIAYNVKLESNQPLSVTNLSFDFDFPTEILTTVSSEQIIVQVDDTTIYSTVEIIDNTVNISFEESLIVAEADSDGNYNLEFDIYLNPVTNESFDLPDFDASFNASLSNLVVTTNDIQTTTNTFNQESLDIAFGDPAISKVKYKVHQSSCIGAKSIEECQLEAGEEFTKTIEITNDGYQTASGLVLNDTYDKENGLVINGGDYEYWLDYQDDGQGAINITESAGNYVNHDENNFNQLYLSIPEKSTLIIKQKLSVNEDIFKKETVRNDISLSQYGQKLEGEAHTKIVVTPLKLKVEITDDEQLVEDGVITPDEALNVTVKMTNMSVRGTSHDNNIEVVSSAPSAIASIDVISVEGDDWSPIEFTSYPSGVNIAGDIAPGESVTVKFRIRFSDIPSGVTTEKLSFISYKNVFDSSQDVCGDINCDEITYNMASDPDYLQLARDQAANHSVIGDDTYKDSLEKSQSLVDQGGLIAKIIDNMRTYIDDYEPLTNSLKRFTTEDNDHLEQISQGIKDWGLGLETDDDEDYSAKYEYCSENNEVSCQLFDLYNRIFKKEESAKTHFEKLLTTIDPTNEEQLGTKPNDDGTEEPTNIGADFNGYGSCVDEKSPAGEECEKVNPGINQRIEIQSDDVQAVQDKIDKILGNELKDIDAEPYQEDLAQINESTNQEMSDVETKNNELFSKKIDVYNENYDRVMKYVDKISKDPSYDKAIKKFRKEEKKRQGESYQILVNVYNLLPNTRLNGMPNRLVYSFIANPVNLIETTVENPIEELSSVDNGILLAVIGIMVILTAILLFIFYWINRGV